MKNIGERIQLIRGDLAREKFAPMTGVSKNTLVNYEKGNSSPPAEYLSKILELHPEINPAWLLTGNGPMEGFSEEFIAEIAADAKDKLTKEPEELVVSQDTLDLLKEIFNKVAGDRRAEINMNKTLIIVNTLHRIYSRNFIESAKFRLDTMEQTVKGLVRLALSDKK